MKTIRKSQRNTILTVILFLIALNSSFAQLNGFMLNPSGHTEDYMKYIRKVVVYNNTNYYTGYLNFSAYKNISSGVLSDPGEPVQKLQIQGGNILLCRTQSAPNGPNLNPTSRNGAILFGDNITPAYDLIHGKWGIEYDDQYSTGGLNFFKPKSSLTATRINHSLFIRNDGYIGINTAMPLTRLHVDGEVTVTALANRDDLFVSTDATGKLILVEGDNMGNCEAGFDVNIGNHLIFGAGNKGVKYAPDGEPWREGLKFIEDKSGEMRLTSFTNTSFTLASLITTQSDPSDGNSIYWATNNLSGGYGFGLTRAGYGGIFGDKNRPSLIMSFNQEGKIGMGCLPGTEKYRLYVKGGIVSEEVLVKLPNANGTWPDYVFDNEYELPNLNSVESFIKINKRLPELPSATEVMENGINVGEMNALLLKKIEELTLYMIAQDKKIQTLEAAVLNVK
jgi:hypothetical protein